MPLVSNRNDYILPTKFLFLTSLFWIFSICSFGQESNVRFIKVVPKRTFHKTKDSVITYPIFTFKNKKLTEKVNQSVKSEFFKLYENHKKLRIEALLKSLASDGLAELRYEHITDDEKFFSFILFHEWIAAYPSYHQSYFAFDKISGYRLTIDSLIQPDKKNDFKDLVINMWRDTLVKYRKELITQLHNNDIDSIDYELALKYTKDDCLDSYSTTTFKLSTDMIEIYFECPFPRIMRTLDPSSSIILNFRELSEYLRPKYRPYSLSN